MTMRLAGGPDGLRLWFQPDRGSESVWPRGGSAGSARSRHDDPRHRPPALAAAAGARPRIGGRGGEAAGCDRHSELRPVRRGGRPLWRFPVLRRARHAVRPRPYGQSPASAGVSVRDVDEDANEPHQPDIQRTVRLAAAPAAFARKQYAVPHPAVAECRAVDVRDGCRNTDRGTAVRPDAVLRHDRDRPDTRDSGAIVDRVDLRGDAVRRVVAQPSHTASNGWSQTPRQRVNRGRGNRLGDPGADDLAINPEVARSASDHREPGAVAAP